MSDAYNFSWMNDLFTHTSEENEMNIKKSEQWLATLAKCQSQTHSIQIIITHLTFHSLPSLNMEQ